MSLDARLIKRLPSVHDSSPFELNVHLTAGPGITVISGPSGSGKTLALNCIAGFARPDEGRILLADQLYFDARSKVCLPPQRRHCGYIFQDHALFPHMTIAENLHFAASLARSRSGVLNRRRRINELLAAFELTELASRKPAQLSGGQKQRAAIGRALLSEPKILLLDEPARGLDARLRNSFYDLLRSAEFPGIPILLVSHDIEETLALADWIVLFGEGRVLQAGSPQTLMEHPATAEIARALGIFNIAPAEICRLDPAANRSRLRLGGQELEGPYFPGHLLGDSGYACIRRSEIAVAPKRHANALSLESERTEYSAYGVRIWFTNGFSLEVSEARHQEIRSLKNLWLEIPWQAVSFVQR